MLLIVADAADDDFEGDGCHRFVPSVNALCLLIT